MLNSVGVSRLRRNVDAKARVASARLAGSVWVKTNGSRWSSRWPVWTERALAALRRPRAAVAREQPVRERLALALAQVRVERVDPRAQLLLGEEVGAGALEDRPGERLVGHRQLAARDLAAAPAHVGGDRPSPRAERARPIPLRRAALGASELRVDLVWLRVGGLDLGADACGLLRDRAVAEHRVGAEHLLVGRGSDGPQAAERPVEGSSISGAAADVAALDVDPGLRVDPRADLRQRALVSASDSSWKDRCPSRSRSLSPNDSVPSSLACETMMSSPIRSSSGTFVRIQSSSAASVRGRVTKTASGRCARQ